MRWATMGAMDRPHAKRFTANVGVFAAVAACLALAFIVYWPRLGDYFVYDDFFFLRAVRNHPFWEVTYRAFTFPEAKPFDEVTLFWRPLTDLYFYVAKVFGLHPEPYHAVNILLHGVVGGLLVVLVMRLTGSVVSGALSGVLFTVLPTYDVVVPWISQVSELLAAALMLGALISYHAYLVGEKPSRRYYAATVVFTGLALLTKESAVILVLLLPALAIAVAPDRRRRSTREVLRSLAPLALLVAALAAVMLAHEYERGEGDYELGWHVAGNAWDYLRWLVLPYPQPATAVRAVGAAAFLYLGVMALLLKERMLAFFVLWAVVALLPFSGFADRIEFRYTYQAALPFTAFVVCGAVTVLKGLPPRLVRPSAALFGVAVAVAVVVAAVRSRDQQDFLASQAAAHEAMVTSVRTLCGPMPSESFVYVVGPPFHDPDGVHTRAALNLYYDRVHGTSVPELPESAASIEPKCVVEYDPARGEYVRVE